MPRDGAVSTTRRTASAPARWPAMRGRPRALAHRPLPSMMMAACSPLSRVLFIAKSILRFRPILSAGCGIFLSPHGLNKGFHVIQIFFERPPAGGCKRVLGSGHAAFETLGAPDILRFLELPGMDAQVSIGGLQQ